MIERTRHAQNAGNVRCTAVVCQETADFGQGLEFSRIVLPRITRNHAVEHPVDVESATARYDVCRLGQSSVFSAFSQRVPSRLGAIPYQVRKAPQVSSGWGCRVGLAAIRPRR